jgi:hypothetical protein
MLSITNISETKLMDKFFISLLTVVVVLFVLKLVGAIAWSWWWIITAPLWVPIILILFGISVLLIIVSFAALFD